MSDKNIGSLLVLEGERLVGIITERDYARKVILKGRTSMDTPVSQIMTKKVYGVGCEQTIEACMALMTEKRVRHLPVLEDDRVTGIISIGDVVKTIISHQQFMIEQLESYIVGG
jgi:CBS domain-containing protein